MKANPTLKTRALLFGAALAVGSAALPAPSGADIITRQQEVTLGREAASQVEAAMPVDTDPIALSRVRRIGRRLLAASEDKNLPFEFHVVEGNEVNAFALPGGFVYVYRGLLQLLPNDDALAFVMGHEMTHALRRHGTRQAGKNLALQAVLTAALGGNAIAAQQLGAALASAKFSRDDEEEADHRGMELMVRAGYNPDSAAETMEVLRRASGGADEIPALLRSHPAPTARLKTLRALAAEWKAKPKPVPPSGPAAVALVAPGLVEPAACGPLPFPAESSDFWPLKVGARWHYRVTSNGVSSPATVTVVEQLAAPAGVYRVERDLGRGIRQGLLLATGPGLVARHPLSPSAGWQPEAVFAAVAAADPSLRFAGLEPVTVPAGTFEAARVEQFAADGTVQAITWYARGIGPVRRQWVITGIVEELERYFIPSAVKAESPAPKPGEDVDD